MFRWLLLLFLLFVVVHGENTIVKDATGEEDSVLRFYPSWTGPSANKRLETSSSLIKRFLLAFLNQTDLEIPPLDLGNGMSMHLIASNVADLDDVLIHKTFNNLETWLWQNGTECHFNRTEVAYYTMFGMVDCSVDDKLNHQVIKEIVFDCPDIDVPTFNTVFKDRPAEYTPKGHSCDEMTDGQWGLLICFIVFLVCFVCFICSCAGVKQ